MNTQFTTLNEINTNPIYQPPAQWLKTFPADLARCIIIRDYTGCRGYLNSKYEYRSTTKTGWCALREKMTSLENKLGRLIYPEDERDEHDQFGFFFGLESLVEDGYMNIDRCGVEVAGRKIRELNVVGHYSHRRKLLIQPETHDDSDDQDHSYCWDITKIKGFLKINGIKGRSKATTMEKAVKLLMSI
jgi:hypothetical protein